VDIYGGYKTFLKQLPGRLPDWRGHLVFWPLFAGGLVLDLWTKKAIFDRLGRGESYKIIDGFVQLIPALNDGAAFGLFASRAFFLTAVSVIAMLLILSIFLFSGVRHRLTQMALGLFAAGVCGNLYDRIFNGGSVRDFIDVVYWPGRHWPTFNVADSLLCIGIGLLVASSLLTEKSDQTHDQQQKSERS